MAVYSYSPPKPLFRVSAYQGRRLGEDTYEVAADDQRFLIDSLGDVDLSRMALVANWPAGLKR